MYNLPSEIEVKIMTDLEFFEENHPELNTALNSDFEAKEVLNAFYPGTNIPTKQVIEFFDKNAVKRQTETREWNYRKDDEGNYSFYSIKQTVELFDNDPAKPQIKIMEWDFSKNEEGNYALYQTRTTFLNRDKKTVAVFDGSGDAIFYPDTPQTLAEGRLDQAVPESAMNNGLDAETLSNALNQVSPLSLLSKMSQRVVSWISNSVDTIQAQFQTWLVEAFTQTGDQPLVDQMTPQTTPSSTNKEPCVSQTLPQEMSALIKSSEEAVSVSNAYINQIEQTLQQKNIVISASEI